MLGAERLGQDEEAVHRRHQGHARGDEERQPQVDGAQHAAQRRADDEAEAPDRAEQTEARGPLLRRGHVGDVGGRHRKAGGGEARQHAADEQPRQVRRERHQQVVEPKAEDRGDQHRPAAEPVRQGAHDRRAEELRHRPDRRQQADRPTGRGGVAELKLLNQRREDRDQQAHRQGVEAEADEDERNRRAPAGGEASSGGGHLIS
jgi:hypothetical protein